MSPNDPVNIVNGVLSNIETSEIGVSNESTLLISTNPKRLYLLIDNKSDVTIYLGFGLDAATSGIHIAAGGNFEMSKMFGNLYLGSVYAIHSSTGEKNISILEGE